VTSRAPKQKECKEKQRKAYKWNGGGGEYPKVQILYPIGMSYKTSAPKFVLFGGRNEEKTLGKGTKGG